MARPCTICRRVDRSEVDKALGGRTSLRAVAKCFETTASALFRHKINHLTSKAVETDGQSGAQENKQDADYPAPEIVHQRLFRLPLGPARHLQPMVPNSGRFQNCGRCGSRSWRLCADGRIPWCCIGLPPEKTISTAGAGSEASRLGRRIGSY